MSLLLDTHAFAWFFLGGLPRRVSAFIEEYEADVFVSAISAYEMALKHRLGLWPDAGPLVSDFDTLMDRAHFKPLEITTRHAIRAGKLSTVHRDPFDRIIAAQAVEEALALVSMDEGVKGMGAQVVWG